MNTWLGLLLAFFFFFTFLAKGLVISEKVNSKVLNMDKMICSLLKLINHAIYKAMHNGCW